MIERWLRRGLRRLGINLPFRHVICAEELKSVAIDAEAGAVVTVRRTLVFLQPPEPGDLRDTIPEPGVASAVYVSPDSLEIGRARRGRGTVVAWRPRTPVTRYALYSHEYSWRAAGDFTNPAVLTELVCEQRTGAVTVEMLTPGAFETAVVFRKPRWRLTTDRSLIKYALRRLDAAGDRPVIAESGQRLEWRIAGPKIGDRYICVAFHQYGVAQAEKRLKETSLIGRLRQRVNPFMPA